MQRSTLERLKEAGIPSFLLDQVNLGPYLAKAVSAEQAAVFFEWLTQNGEPDTQRVRQEMTRCGLGKTRYVGLRIELTVQDLLDYRLREADIQLHLEHPGDMEPHLAKTVSLEQAARFFEWLTDDDKPDTLRVRREVAQGRLGSTRSAGFRIKPTIQDLFEYDGRRLHRQRWLLRLLVWIQSHRWLSIPVKAIPLLGFFLTIYSQIYPDALSFIINPPDTTLTVILDTSSPMAEAYLGGLTRWRIASEAVQRKLDPQESVNDVRKVAIWSQRDIGNAMGSSCKEDDFSLLTKRYVPPDQVDVNSLLSSIVLKGKPSPGRALWAAVENMPRFTLKGWKHHALVFSSSSNTCSGQTPAREICDNLKNIADHWSFGPNSEFSHEIVVVDMDAGRVGSDPKYCSDRKVDLWKVDLDLKNPVASGLALCEADLALCNLITNLISGDPMTPAPATMTPIPTPSSTLVPTPMSNPTGAPPAPTPSAIPSATSTNTPTATPRPIRTMTPSPSPTQDAGVIVPIPTPALKLRAPTGRAAAVREKCLSGRVIGEIGFLLQYLQQLEADVVAIPEDLQLLPVNGCVWVFTGIVGRPDYGFSGYVRSEDICVVGSSYDYWKDMAIFYQTIGVDKLRRCPD